MKKIFTLLLFLGMLSNVFSQGTVPNNGFENWTDTVTCVSWGSISIAPMPPIFPGFYGLTRTTDAHSGSYAAKMKSQNVSGYGVLPGAATLGAINFITQSVSGGTPFTQRPQTLSFWYKFQPAGGDTMSVIIMLTKRNTVSNVTDTIAFGYFGTGTAATSYTQANITLDYQSAETPDTMNILAIPSSGQMTDGSTLYLDDLTLSGTVVSVKNIAQKENISVLPNPSNGSFEIICSDNSVSTFKICNAIGKEVFNGTINGKKSINLQHLAKGLYFAEIINGTKKTIKKIVIQ